MCLISPNPTVVVPSGRPSLDVAILALSLCRQREVVWGPVSTHAVLTTRVFIAWYNTDDNTNCNVQLILQDFGLTCIDIAKYGG